MLPSINAIHYASDFGPVSHHAFRMTVEPADKLHSQIVFILGLEEAITGPTAVMLNAYLPPKTGSSQPGVWLSGYKNRTTARIQKLLHDKLPESAWLAYPTISKTIFGLPARVIVHSAYKLAADLTIMDERSASTASRIFPLGLNGSNGASPHLDSGTDCAPSIARKNPKKPTRTGEANMKKQIKNLLVAAAVTAAPMLTAPVVSAADYPSRPVKFIVPWPPGDLEDILTRIIAEEMTSATGKPATVVNKAGGGGLIGAAEVARTPPNGLNIGSFVADILTTHVLAGNAPYDKDTFEPVGIFLDYPFVLATKADSPYNNLKELAEYSQTHDVSLGHFGYQSLPTAITFKAAAQAGVKFSSDAPFDTNDCSTLATGDADVINTNTQLILACLKSGEVKVIASMTSERISVVPDVPTLAEQTGISQTTWNGLFVKKGTPEQVKKRIAEIAQNALQDQRATDLSANTGAGIYWIGGAEAEKRVAEDFEASKELLQFMK